MKLFARLTINVFDGATTGTSAIEFSAHDPVALPLYLASVFNSEVMALAVFEAVNDAKRETDDAE